MAESASPPGSSTDKYVVVARRYRPKNFAELVGQGHVGQALKNAIETHRVGHAYLFTGARGVGKTSTARIFAKALNAPEGPTATPDNESDICQAIDAGEDVDVLEIDGASNRGIDEIRSLRAGVGVRPSRSRYKIYIIDEVHMLTQAAFNALLKTLEEPPEHVKFIFCTTDPEKIPITVLSRCQRFDFAPVHTDEIMGRLREIVDAEGAQADDEALRLIARRAAGSMRDSQSLLEQVLSFSSGRLSVASVHGMLGTADDQRLQELTSALIARDAKAAIEQADAAILAGVDAGQLGEQLLGHFRDLMVATVGCQPQMLRYCSESMHDDLKQRGSNWGVATILAVVSLLDQTLVRIRQSVHGRVLLETALIQICQLPNLQRVADILAGVQSQHPAPGARPAATGEKKKAELNAAVGGAVAAAADRAVNAAVGGTGEAAANGAANAASDEASSRPALPTSYPAAEWSVPGVQLLWNRAVERLDDLTADLARQASRVEPLEEGRIRVLFPADLQLTKSRCEKPEQKSKLEEALAAVAARRVLLELGADAGAVAKPPPAPRSSGERRQRQRELQTHPWVQKCVEIFDAEVVRVDEPRA